MTSDKTICIAGCAASTPVGTTAKMSAYLKESLSAVDCIEKPVTSLVEGPGAGNYRNSIANISLMKTYGKEVLL